MSMTYKKTRLFTYFCLIALCLMATACERSSTLANKTSRSTTLKSNVAPPLANACEIAAANKYYLSQRFIHAYHATQAADGSITVKLKADLREAVCTVSATGHVQSVVDVSPKSEDQIAAERAAG